MPFVLIHFLFLCNGILLANDDEEVIWYLVEIQEGNKVYQSDEINNCNVKEELKLTYTYEPFDLPEYGIDGFKVGERNYIICVLDPVSLKYLMERVSCGHTLLQDRESPSTKWVEMTKGSIVILNVTQTDNKLILREIEDIYYPERTLRVYTYERAER